MNADVIAGAPKALLDAAGTDIIASVGEPFRIKIPFRGSPIPTVTWFNVRCFLFCERIYRIETVRFVIKSNAVSAVTELSLCVP